MIQVLIAPALIVGLVIAFATSIFVGRVAARAIKRAGVDDALPPSQE